MVGSYPFEGSPADVSGNGRTATVYGAGYVAGRSGSALDLNGTSGYAALPGGILAGGP